MPGYKVGAKMKRGEAQCQRDHGESLKPYLRKSINNNVSDITLGKEFGVDRKTIANWKRLLLIKTIRRAVAA